MEGPIYIRDRSDCVLLWRGSETNRRFAQSLVKRGGGSFQDLPILKINQALNARSAPLGVHGFESHPLHPSEPTSVLFCTSNLQSFLVIGEIFRFI